MFVVVFVTLQWELLFFCSSRKNGIWKPFALFFKSLANIIAELEAPLTWKKELHKNFFVPPPPPATTTTNKLHLNIGLLLLKCWSYLVWIKLLAIVKCPLFSTNLVCSDFTYKSSFSAARHLRQLTSGGPRKAKSARRIPAKTDLLGTGGRFPRNNTHCCLCLHGVVLARDSKWTLVALSVFFRNVLCIIFFSGQKKSLAS